MKFLLSFVLYFFFFLFPSWAFDVPTLKAPVNDYANIVDSNTEAQLNLLLKQLKDQTGTQLAILTVEDLQGESIESASIQVVDKWQLGTAEEDNGVLLFVSKNDRQLRIEVGQGHEGNLTDLHSKRIIDYVIVPEFKKSQFSRGILNGAITIISYTNSKFIKDIGENPDKYRSQSEKKESKSLISLLIRLIILAIIISRFGIFSLFIPGLGGHGRGGFGSGGGFGGFGGGGGGFSGGGSSGRW